MTAATTGFSQIYNPTALHHHANLAWTDLNTDDIAQGERGCVYPAAGARSISSTLPANFGIRALSVVRSGLKRPYQSAYNLGASHEMLPGTSLTVEWFHSDFKNLIARNNINRTADDYTPVNVVQPARRERITAYNVSAAKANAVQNIDSTDPDLKRNYNGIEVNFNARLPRGARIFGGTSTERTIRNSCSAASTDPNLSIYCDQVAEQHPVDHLDEAGRHVSRCRGMASP